MILLLLIIIVVAILISCIRIVPQSNAYVIERLGKYIGTWQVGVHFLVPIIDRIAKKVSLKEQVADFPPQPRKFDTSNRYRPAMVLFFCKISDFCIAYMRICMV